ncbi:MAG: ADP-ribosylation/crystallin J1 [Pseudomonadota bacterium]
MELFRPTGRAERDLVAASGWRAWPPRLPEQPIFYPVLSFDYAERIARDWNSVLAAPENEGFVMRFEIDRATARRYPPQLAGGSSHQELWIPADQLNAFNEGIVGLIEVVAYYRNGKRVGDGTGASDG